MEHATSKEYSSLPLIIGITSAIVITVSGGWLALGGKAIPGDEEPVVEGSNAVSPINRATATPIDIDSNLRKAQLSVGADLLVSPPRQNALFYYGRVLTADPDNRIATAELDALLSSILLAVDDHLTAGEFDEAYDLSMAAARQVPDHPLIEDMRKDLNEFVAMLVAEAEDLATTGNDQEALEILSTLQGLPGLSNDYLETVQQALLDVQQMRADTEQELVDDEQAEKERINQEWAQRVSEAIAAGNLIEPEGESARDLLAELDAPADLKGQLSEDFQNAMLAATQSRFDQGELDVAESYLLAATDFGTDEDILEPLRVDLERSLIERESNRPIALSEFVQIQSTPARYPARASNRDITGWVEVSFIVTESGQTTNIEVVRAEPQDTFDSSVIEAVQQWTFEPRLFRGQPIDQRTNARLVFNLE